MVDGGKMVDRGKMVGGRELVVGRNVVEGGKMVEFKVSNDVMHSLVVKSTIFSALIVTC